MNVLIRRPRGSSPPASFGHLPSGYVPVSIVGCGLRPSQPERKSGLR
jgi:hypothetical protein